MTADTQPPSKEWSDNPWIWLPYLLFYFFPWLFRAPTPEELIVTAIALPLFFLIYFVGYGLQGRRGLIFAFALGGLGLAVAPVMTTASVFVIYGAAALGYVRPRSGAIKALGAYLVLIAGCAWMFGLPIYFWVPSLFFTVMTGGACLLSAEAMEKNRRLEAAYAEQGRLAAMAERERIARDLHDLLGHTLSVIAVKADLAARLIDQDVPRAKAEVSDIQATTRQALKEIREAVTGMRQASLSAALTQARQALAAADVDLTAQAGLPDLPDAVEQAFAMLIREAVTNVVRHADATTCRIRLDLQGDQALLVVEDDGRGGIAREGNGLKGMRERVAALGGRFSLQSRGGTRIEASLPLQQVTA
ncbi:MAG: histidine kinase [Rhodothalassiaceae bacterium]